MTRALKRILTGIIGLVVLGFCIALASAALMWIVGQ